MPDVFVFPHPIDPMQGSFNLTQDGAPVLIIEVLSESTYEADLDLVHPIDPMRQSDCRRVGVAGVWCRGCTSPGKLTRRVAGAARASG
jgi:hypothetical protein